ncbi:hypothetical protein GCM10009853_091420 [Glycomyces scopariae]|uniref:Uncharacterized protein n=1 Tax=Glycomyces sambucus TaxID=380244 RepID=A0A1G9FIH3_9ACTN|nr:hypothetical protein [Glycomyces sambucus]SDK88186.1 hypothetical protein SAMN05216298_1816 [Glycomyces sambucus]
MAYQAPDPEQFAGAAEAYGYMAPLAAVNITLPAYVFGGPCVQLSRIIYLNQCNPGDILTGAAQWLQMAQKFDEAKEAFQARLDGLAPEAWAGEDRDAFDAKAEKIVNQLQAIHAFAMHLGISMFAIGLMLCVMIPIMLVMATVLMALAITTLIVQQFVPAGPIMALSWRATAMTFGTTALTALKAMDEACSMAAKVLAGFIAANMTLTWINMAANGNIISPAATIGSTGYSFLQGLAQLAVVKLMAPGRGATGGMLSKISTGANGALMKAGPGLIGGVGAQGIYNIGNSAAGDDAPNKMTDAGVDVGAYDFIPDTFGDKARAGDDAPSWRPDGSKPEPEEEGAEGEAAA